MQKKVNEVQLEDVDFGSATIEYYPVDAKATKEGAAVFATLKKANVKFVREFRKGGQFIWLLSGLKEDLFKWVTTDGGMDEEDAADFYEDELFECEKANEDLEKINKIVESISLISGVSRIPAPLNAKFLTLGEAELAAAQFYATISTWAAARGLVGLEKWAMAESGEEFTHYQDVVGYLNSMFGENINPVAAADLAKPIVRTDSLEEVMSQAYEFEKKIEEAYKAALNLAGEVKDATSENWLADKYKEQVGATQAALEMLNKVRNIVSGDGLVFFDAALAEGSPTAG